MNDKKNSHSHLGKWAIMGPKIVDPHNSGSVVRFFFKILDNEKGQ